VPPPDVARARSPIAPSAAYTDATRSALSDFEQSLHTSLGPDALATLQSGENLSADQRSAVMRAFYSLVMNLPIGSLAPGVTAQLLRAAGINPKTVGDRSLADFGDAGQHVFDTLVGSKDGEKNSSQQQLTSFMAPLASRFGLPIVNAALNALSHTTVTADVTLGTDTLHGDTAAGVELNLGEKAWPVTLTAGLAMPLTTVALRPSLGLGVHNKKLELQLRAELIPDDTTAKYASSLNLSLVDTKTSLRLTTTADADRHLNQFDARLSQPLGPVAANVACADVNQVAWLDTSLDFATKPRHHIQHVLSAGLRQPLGMHDHGKEPVTAMVHYQLNIP